MLTSHKHLLKYWHDAHYKFSEVQVCYVDRGAPGDHSCVDGTDIRLLTPYYFEVVSMLGAKYIPYHRIRKIIYNDEIVWER